VLEKRWGEAIRDELEDQLVRAGLQRAERERGLDVLDVQDLRGQRFCADGSFYFEARVNIRPRIKLPDYDGIEVQAPPAEPAPEEIEAGIRELRERFADYPDHLDPNHKAAWGDMAVVDYECFALEADGGERPLSEVSPEVPAQLAGGKSLWFRLEQDEKKREEVFPDMTEALLGAGVGERREARCEEPEDGPLGAEFSGRKTLCRMLLRELKREVLPEFDDALAARVEPGFSSQ